MDRRLAASKPHLLIISEISILPVSFPEVDAAVAVMSDVSPSDNGGLSESFGEAKNKEHSVGEMRCIYVVVINVNYIVMAVEM